jgi:hypothetical protein
MPCFPARGCSDVHPLFRGGPLGDLSGLLERRDVVQGTLGATGTAVKLITVKYKVAPALRSCELRLVLRARVREPVAVEQAEVGCPAGAGDLAHRLRILHRHESRNT